MAVLRGYFGSALKNHSWQTQETIFSDAGNQTRLAACQEKALILLFRFRIKLLKLFITTISWNQVIQEYGVGEIP